MRVARLLGPTALAVSLAATALVAAPSPARAGAQIVVTTLADTTANDGACSLREAVNAANNDVASGGAAGECVAGSGLDLVLFGVVGLVELGSGLPEITSDMEIEGGGYGGVDGNGHRLIFTNAGTTVSLRGLTLTGGHQGYSGAVFNSGTMLIENSRITANTADHYGAGVLTASGSSLEIRQSTIDHNTAASAAGLYVGDGATVTVKRSTIAANTATGNSGGIESQGSLTIANSTIANNIAGPGAGANAFGGGIYISGGAGATLNLANVTISGNSARSGGGGIETGSAPTIVVRNSIILGNAAAANPDMEGPIDTSITNLVGGATAGILDPAGLRGNGGTTQTIALAATAATAIDAATGATCAGALVGAVDQRGVARPVGACDIGAVERDKIAPTVTSATSPSLRSGIALSGSRGRVHLEWSAADDAAGAGIRSYIVERSFNGGPFAAFAKPAASHLDVSLVPNKPYRFRVRAVDFDGNQSSAWVTSATVTIQLVQQSSSTVTFSGTWKAKTASAFSGGSARRGNKAGAAVRFTFKGRGIAFVSLRGAAKGKARIYIGATLLGTIDLGGATRYRWQAWSKTWATSATRTIKVVVAGTAGRPEVDADAFLVLK